MKKNRAILILKNTLTNYLRQVVMLATFFVLTPFIAKSLGNEALGLWSLIQATVGFFSLLDLGFAQAVVKYVADARGREDEERLRDITATLFWIYAALGGASMAVTLGLAPFVTRLLGIPKEMEGVARAVFVIIGARSAFSFPMGMFSGVLTGFQLQSWSNIIRSTGMLAYGALALWVLLAAPSLELVAWVSLATHVVTDGVCMAVCLIFLRGVSLSPHRFQWRLVREVGAFSSYFFLIQVSSLIYMRVDTILVQAFLTLSAVALYTVAARAAESAATFCRQLTNALTPMIAELKGAGEEKNIRALFLKGAKIATAMAAPLLVGMFWFSQDLLVAWMGRDYAQAAPACRIVLLAMMVSVANGGAANVLTMTGFQRYVALSFVAGQGVNLVLTIFLVWQTPLGINGVALATLAASLFADFWLVARRACREYHVSLPEYLRLTVWPSAPSSAVMIGGLWLAERWLAASSLWRIGVL
ncbi:MAG TPA: flippase, partial [Candidatus Brocadiia bacterium]|nr:flippase [Candidatus Brocadiia bacterium]